MKNVKEYRRSRLKANLNFNEGFAERPIYSIKASTNEKEKGLAMISLIFQNFNLSIDNYLKYLERDTKAMVDEINNLSIDMEHSIFPEPRKLNRDELGNLISPFASKKKLI